MTQEQKIFRANFTPPTEGAVLKIDSIIENFGTSYKLAPA